MTTMTTISSQNFTFDGQPISFEPGQTVGAALINAGIRSWRTTRRSATSRGGNPRGLFCGIGVCFDCLITADGQPNNRACLLQAAPGMAVTSQNGTGWT
jgi:hypothetical protein